MAMWLLVPAGTSSAAHLWAPEYCIANNVPGLAKPDGPCIPFLCATPLDMCIACENGMCATCDFRPSVYAFMGNTQSSETYVVENKVCKRCHVDHCLQCIPGNSSQCFSCDNGYGIQRGLTCAPCTDPHCERCPAGELKCAICIPGYDLILGTLNEGLCAPVAPGRTAGHGDPVPVSQDIPVPVPLDISGDVAASAVSGDTPLSDPNCKRAITGCVECWDPFVALDGKCEPCVDRHCLKCSASPQMCEVCSSDKLILFHGKCVHCAIHNCERCARGNPRMCEKCTNEASFFMGACRRCMGFKCERCTGDSLDACSECANGYVLVNGTCTSCLVKKCDRCQSGNPDQCSDCEGMRQWNGTLCVPECDVANCALCTEDSSTQCSECIVNFDKRRGGQKCVSSELSIAEVSAIVGSIVLSLAFLSWYCYHLKNKGSTPGTSALGPEKQLGSAVDYPVGIPVPEVANVPYAKPAP